MQPSEPMRRPVIGFLSDFGFDGAAATCRAVMLSICPDAQIVDIAHSVPKYAIADGAFVLAAALPYFPIGVHLAVVDPGVGTERRPVALRTQRGDVLVGPDNGLLVPSAEALGSIDAARELTNREWWLPVTSSTFHGRDIFAPVTAHLAAGTAGFDSVGPPIDTATIERLPEAEVRIEDGTLHTEVAYVDTFGNVRLAGTRDEVVAALGAEGAKVTVTLAGGAPREAQFVRTFGEVDAAEALFYVDSSGHPALGLRQGNLAAQTGTRRGDRVVIHRG
jgi:S-adenosyl-L-methionine hydrolase (adenosine-forming)